MPPPPPPLKVGERYCTEEKFMILETLLLKEIEKLCIWFLGNIFRLQFFQPILPKTGIWIQVIQDLKPYLDLDLEYRCRFQIQIRISDPSSIKFLVNKNIFPNCKGKFSRSWRYKNLGTSFSKAIIFIKSKNA